MHKKVEQQVDVLPPLSNQPKKKKIFAPFQPSALNKQGLRKLSADDRYIHID